MIIFLQSLSYEERNFIEKLYKDQRVFFYRVAFALLKNKTLAEEALATTFIKLMEDIERVQGLDPEALVPFSLTVLKNEAINIYRKEKRHIYTDKKDLDIIEDLGEKIEEDLIRKDQVQSLIFKAGLLSQEEKDLLIYRYKHDLTYREIGKIMGISEQTATKRNQRILEKIRKSIEDDKSYD